MMSGVYVVEAYQEVERLPMLSLDWFSLAPGKLQSHEPVQNSIVLSIVWMCFFEAQGIP